MDKFDEKVIGYDSIKETLRQIADVLKRPEAYKEKGVSMPRGLLMESAPGLGKSLMASILMEESGRKSFVFRRINEGNTFLGEMKDIFDVAKEEAPSILLLEDLNLYVESNSPYAPEWACLQACIDETSDADIFVIATTNDTRYMPQSLLRPGRFDYILNLNPPLGKTAEDIVSYYLRDKNLAKDVQISDIVEAMPQVSCATLETVMNLAAINSVYRDHSYNLDATIKRSDAPRATVPEENGLSSPDIQYGDEQASLKFYKDAKSSAMRQSDPGYGNQHRIVPSDQVDDAKAELAKKAQENRAKGRESAATQQEKTRDLIDDRIHGKDGTESTPMTKKQNDDLSKTIKKDENGNAYVDNEAMDKVMEDTGIKGKVKNAIRKNEIQGLASAVAIGAGIGFTIGFAVSLAQSGITPDSVKYAFVNGGKSGVASGVQSVVGYGIGRTVGQVATNAIEGVLSNAGLEITANISKMCTMGTVGAITVAVFSTVQFVKLIYHGECLKSAAIQVGKQALFSLSLLAISIAAQGMWGGPAGIIVSIGTGIVIVSYTIADAVHQRTFAEECHIKTIEEYGRLALRHLNELQFA